MNRHRAATKWYVRLSSLTCQAGKPDVPAEPIELGRKPFRTTALTTWEPDLVDGRARFLHFPTAERTFAVKVAVATFGERVSPRFDCAQTFLVATVDEGRFSQRQHLFASGWGPHERIHRLVALGVEAVVCGGVDRRSAELLESAGVKVFARRTGRIEDVLTSLFQVNEQTELES
jgi:predicted Fe-Mo cluster-binding NifX family protein